LYGGGDKGAKMGHGNGKFSICTQIILAENTVPAAQ
jgi:hypothetical protein